MFDRGEAVRRFALNLARYSGLAPMLSGTMGGVGAILMLHRVTRAPSRPLGINRHLSITPEFLDEVLTEMHRLGYRFVTMDETIGAVCSGRSDQRIATVTFDDAYKDNLYEALPVLEAHGVPFTIYVSPGLTSGDIDLWWDVLEEIVTVADSLQFSFPDDDATLDCSTPAFKVEANRRLHDFLTLQVAEAERQPILRALAASAGVDPSAPSRDTLMDWAEVRRICAHPLVTIGAHTMSHYNLRRLSEDDARREMVEARNVIEAGTGEAPRHMAYPYGYESAVGPREARLAREAGFASAVTTRHGVLQPGHADHLHALPRLSVNGRYQQVAHMRTMLSGVTTRLANAGRGLVTV